MTRAGRVGGVWLERRGDELRVMAATSLNAAGSLERCGGRAITMLKRVLGTPRTVSNPLFLKKTGGPSLYAK